MYDVLMLLKGEILAALRCLMPAKITAVNTAAGTVDVQISALQQTATGEYLNYPPLKGIPAITIQGGGMALKFPVAVDDQCLVFFADRCMAAWKQTGSPQPLPNPRMHDLSDGFALVGVNSPLQLLTLLTATEGGIATAGAKIGIDNDTDLITIASATDSLKAIINDTITQIVNVNTGIIADTSTASAIIPATIAAATAANVQLALILTRLGLLLK